MNNQNPQTSERNDPAIDPDTDAGENSYTPDFEPGEHESPDKTKEENQTGETDRDIDTAGG